MRNTVTVLSNVFSLALDSGAVKANPCAGGEAAPSSRDEMLFIDPSQIAVARRCDR